MSPVLPQGQQGPASPAVRLAAGMKDVCHA